MKLCRSCSTDKPRDMFTRSKKTKDGLQSYCKSCYAARAAAHRMKNPELVKANCKKSKDANRDKIAETKRRYRAANPEKVKEARRISYAKNRESELARASEYKKENRHIIRPLVAKRMASKFKATPGWFDKAASDAMYEQAAEFEKLTGFSWHVDHIVPLQSDLVCGLHWHGNMQVISASQNQSKSNRHWPDMPTET